VFALYLQANDKGSLFPIWATCLGYEMMHIMVAKEKPIRITCDAENLPLPLKFVKGVKSIFRDGRDGRFFPLKNG